MTLRSRYLLPVIDFFNHAVDEVPTASSSRVREFEPVRELSPGPGVAMTINRRLGRSDQEREGVVRVPVYVCLSASFRVLVRVSCVSVPGCLEFPCLSVCVCVHVCVFYLVFVSVSVSVLPTRACARL